MAKNPFIGLTKKDEEENPFIGLTAEANRNNPFIGITAKAKKAQPKKDGDVLKKLALAHQLQSKAVFNPATGAMFSPAGTRTITESIGLDKPSKYIKGKLTKPPTTKDIDSPIYALKELAANALGGAADIATTPATYMGGSALKALTSNIPAQVFLRKNLPHIAKGLISPVTPDEFAYQGWLKNPQVSLTPKEVISGQMDPVKKITQALKSNEPIREAQEALYTQTRSKLSATISKIGKETRGQAGFIKQKGALSGKMPRAEFRGIRKQLTQNDVDHVFNLVEDNQDLLPFEKITAKEGLLELLGSEEASKVPTRSAMALLRKVFPEDFINTVISKRPVVRKVLENVANIPRSLMSSADFSAPLRQGAFLIGRPKQFLPAFKNMFKYFFSEKAYQGLGREIQKRPTAPLMRQAGLRFAEMGSKLSQREEMFMSSYAEKLPFGIGTIQKASARAHTGFLNKLSADVFDDIVKSATKLGTQVDDHFIKSSGRFINSAVGRGGLPKLLESSKEILNAVFFSPRLNMSRVHLMNPVFYHKLHPAVRKEALKSLLTFGAFASSVLGLAKLGGAEIGADARSADFGKAKEGNTRYDPWAGFTQYARFAVQMATGEHVSSTTGVKTTTGEGYKPLTRDQIALRFLETKEAPIASFITMLIRGQTRLGKRPDYGSEIVQRLTPMVLQDMYDLYQERGPKGLFMASPAIFGVGVQTYRPTATDVVRSSNSVKKNRDELIKQGRIPEARKLHEKNKELMKKGELLNPYQEDLNKWEKMRKDLIKGVKFSPERKKSMIQRIDVAIKRKEESMEKVYKRIK